MHYNAFCLLLLFLSFWCVKGFIDPLLADYFRHKEKCSKMLRFTPDLHNISLEYGDDDSNDFFKNFGKSEDTKCFLTCLAENAGHFRGGILNQDHTKKYIPSGITINIGRCKAMKFVNKCDQVYFTSKCIYDVLHPR